MYVRMQYGGKECRQTRRFVSNHKDASQPVHPADVEEMFYLLHFERQYFFIVTLLLFVFYYNSVFVKYMVH